MELKLKVITMQRNKENDWTFEKAILKSSFFQETIVSELTSEKNLSRIW